MQTLYTTNLAMIRSPRKLKIFNIDHAWHTGAIQGTSRDKLYQEQGLESLSDSRWSRKLAFFNKIINNLSQAYLTAYLNLSISYCLFHLPYITPEYHVKIFLGIYYVERKTFKIYFIETASMSLTNKMQKLKN